jgi:hypothetical protein
MTGYVAGFFANETFGKWMFRIAFNLGYPAACHLAEKSTAVRAVLGAYRWFPHRSFTPEWRWKIYA